jgi:hypothetical protein
MYCPQCKAEYRQGFTRCADCEVDLVEGYVEAVRHPLAKKAVTSEEYRTQLWSGSDPYFYMELLSNLWRLKVDCYGAPENPPVPKAMRALASGSLDAGKFEVWISEENLTIAKWILDSSAEDLEKNPPHGRVSNTLHHDLSPETVAICPLCFAEFTTASSNCPNCEVPLRLAQPGMNIGDSARLLCRIDHPGFTTELRDALKAAGIPFNNAKASRGTLIPGVLYGRHYAVVVLEEDFERARKVLTQVLQHWEFEPGAGFAIPEGLLTGYWPARANENGWLREDLSAPVWSGHNILSLNDVGRALREHEIPYRAETEPLGVAKIFSHPEDEGRAEEIIREVVEGRPLE